MRDVADVRGLAHITGGGLLDNIPRIMPQGLEVEIDRSAWKVPPLFEWLARAGGVDEIEMHRVFNMGIGMVAALPESDSADVLEGEYRWKPFRIGKVAEGGGGVRLA